MNTLIDFYADWCGPCIAMKPVFEELEKELAGKINFKKINVDENPAEAQKYGVMSIPTFVVVSDSGEEVDRRMGAMPKETFKAWLENHIS